MDPSGAAAGVVMNEAMLGGKRTLINAIRGRKLRDSRSTDHVRPARMPRAYRARIM
jgi:hypothetical protein